MKNILYVYFGGDLTQNIPGVQSKILSKIEALNNLNNVKCVGLSFGKEEKFLKKGNSEIKILNVGNFKPWRYFNGIQLRRRIYKRLDCYLENALVDLIIMRYPLASPQLFRFVKKNQRKVILEHNTFEIEELKLSLKQGLSNLRMTLSIGNYFNFIEIFIVPLLNEYLYSKLVFKNIKFGVAVTNEISNRNSQRYPFYRNVTISNGIDTSDYKLTYVASKGSRKIKAFMLCGYPAAWHGIDRIIRSLKSIKVENDFEITLIGQFDKNLISQINTFNIPIRIKKNMTKEDLDVFLRTFDFSLGTLGLYNKGMTEASPLKVRESLTRGFPTVIAYDDTDLQNHEEFIYRLPNDESNIDFNEIIKWYLSLSSNPQLGQEIMSFAQQKLDINLKMKLLSSFLS